jgi:hypothetical protein
MDHNNNLNQTVEKLGETTSSLTRPDDEGNVQIDGFVRIFDPNSKETILEVRE